MWRLKSVGHKAADNKHSLEELKTKRRQHEKAVRQARRDRQLVSKRLLLHDDDDDEDDEDTMDSADSADQVVELYRKVQRSRAEETEVHLRALSRALKHPEAQLAFIRQENSIHVLIRHLSGHMAQNRLHACRCLHRLSQSNAAPYCSPAAPYLITYLSGQSPALTEVCVYVLGNMVPDSQKVRDKLLAQGLIPALDNCLQVHRGNMAVSEAVGFTLSQLLQSSEAAETIIPAVLSSALPEQLLSVLTTSDPQFGPAPSIEAAWCLHYLTSSDHAARLLPLQALGRCSSLLGTLGGAVAAGNTEEGVELLLWPLLRCVGNLLCCGPPTLTPMTPVTPVTPGGEGEGGAPPSMHLGEAVRLVAALCAFAQAFLPARPALARESLWVLNNLTADSIMLCRAVLRLKLLPVLMTMLPFSEGINTMVLRVMCNMTHHLGDQMVDGRVLTAVTHTLKMTDTHLVCLSLELLHMLLDARIQVWAEFVRGGGVSLLEVIQFNAEEELRTRAAFLLDNHHLTSELLP